MGYQELPTPSAPCLLLDSRRRHRCPRQQPHLPALLGHPQRTHNGAGATAKTTAAPTRHLSLSPQCRRGTLPSSLSTVLPSPLSFPLPFPRPCISTSLPTPPRPHLLRSMLVQHARGEQGGQGEGGVAQPVALQVGGPPPPPLPSTGVLPSPDLVEGRKRLALSETSQHNIMPVLISTCGYRCVTKRRLAPPWAGSGRR